MPPTVGDVLFVDTNVLLTATDERRSQHREARRLFTRAVARGWHLASTGQILREYLVVATRPAEVNGLGLGVSQAIRNVNSFLRHLHLYAENEAVAARLRRLTVLHGVRGARLHDANIAATMLVHGVNFLVTQNESDFAPFEGIETLPVSVNRE